MNYFSDTAPFSTKQQKKDAPTIDDSQLKVRDEIKDFVKQWNNFVEEYYRVPMYGCIDPHEVELYNKRMVKYNIRNITKDEALYLEKNLAKSKVRRTVVKHVNAYNEFVLLNGYPPKTLGERTARDNEYNKWPCLNKPLELNEYEIKYIEENTIKVTVRLKLREFITQFNNFVQANGRYPRSSCADKQESSLYKAWKRFQQPEILTDKEKEYYQEHIKTIPIPKTINSEVMDENEIKRGIIEFVKNYNEFVQTYGSEPRRTGTRPNEVRLYKQKWRFTKIQNVKPAEAEFLTANGFKVEGYEAENSLTK